MISLPLINCKKSRAGNNPPGRYGQCNYVQNVLLAQRQRRFVAGPAGRSCLFCARFRRADCLCSRLGRRSHPHHFIAQFAMSLTGAMLTRRQSREIEQTRTAIDSMAQGLCMFDAAERLVVCNAQYYKMYELTPADVKPGSTLSEVLAKRVAKGTFSRDPQVYRKEFLTAVGLGRTIVHEVKSKGGHLLLVTNHPMMRGGWIGTHEDITERRQAEQQRTTMQHQEERRAVIENAISAFRERAENLLRTVADSAVQTSNEASTNVETAAIAADELSSSIAEIGRRLNQTTEVVRVAVDEA